MAATAETKMEEESAENSSAKTMAASGDLHLLHLSKNVNNRQRSSIQTKHAHAHTLVINQSQQQQQQATTKNYQQQQQQQQSLFVSSEAATVIIGNGHKSNGNDFTAGTIAGNERIGGALSPPIAMDLVIILLCFVFVWKSNRDEFEVIWFDLTENFFISLNEKNHKTTQQSVRYRSIE